MFDTSVKLNIELRLEFKKNLKGIFVKTTEFKSTKSLLSVKNCYSQARKLGPDRWAQIIAAHKIFKKIQDTFKDSKLVNMEKKNYKKRRTRC